MDDDLESFRNIVQVDYYTPMSGLSAFRTQIPANSRPTQLHYDRDRQQALERAQQLMERSHVYEGESSRMQALLLQRQLLIEEVERLQQDQVVPASNLAQRLGVRTLQAQLREMNAQLNNEECSEQIDEELTELRKMNLQISEFNDAAQLQQTNFILEQSNLSVKLEEIALIEAGNALLEEQRLMEPHDFEYVR